jgi:hypothetical protein
MSETTPTTQPASRNPMRVFPPYMKYVREKAMRVEKFMNEHNGDPDNFGTWRQSTLATYIAELRVQLKRMERDWDDLRAVQLSQVDFDKINGQIDNCAES